jgi:hypothetical protein
MQLRSRRLDHRDRQGLRVFRLGPVKHAVAGAKMVTIVWGQGLSDDGRETFDSVREARALFERDSDMSPEELDRLFETGKFVDENNGSWIMVE